MAEFVSNSDHFLVSHVGVPRRITSHWANERHSDHNLTCNKIEAKLEELSWVELPSVKQL